MDYTYRVDAAFIPKWRARFQYMPFQVLNEIKKHCKGNGFWYATSDGACYDYNTNTCIQG
jgi:hypothetical protein